jgi:hypothetical protein
MILRSMHPLRSGIVPVRLLPSSHLEQKNYLINEVIAVHVTKKCKHKRSKDGYKNSYISTKRGSFVMSSGIFPVRFLPDKTL